MKPALIEEPFDDSGWLFEIKWDGYRAITQILNGEITLYSRNFLSFNSKFPEIVRELKKIKYDTVLDGEIVVLNNKGKPDFQLIQDYQKTKEGFLIYNVFDIIYFDGYLLKDTPLLERKNLLQKILPESEKIKFGDYVLGDGIEFFKLAAKEGIEGIVAKKINSSYQAGVRGKDWLKIKTKLRQEAVIGGFTKSRGGDRLFGALVLGVYEGKDLVYIGHSGSGFSERRQREMMELLKPLIIKSSPFKKIPKTNMAATWVKPELICEVAFSEWTREGYMRQPVFQGLREDKEPRQVNRELPFSTMEEAVSKDKGPKDTKKDVKLKFTNLNKIYFPDDGYTKGDIIQYYDDISEYILPYLKDRPESLNRYPNGIYEENFYHKDMGETVPDWAETFEVYSESNHKHIKYFICNDKTSLLYLANLGCIEINPWFSRIQNLDYPDYTVFDLDPVDIEFDKVIDAALEIRKLLDEIGVKSYCKTSGATGLHVYVPLSAQYNYDTAKEFTRLLCRIVRDRIPDFTSIERMPHKRGGKVYLDYLQNRAGQTLAAPYSVRPRKGAPVAAPVEWEELERGFDPAIFNIRTILKRLEKKGDIFKPVLGEGIDIEECIKKLEDVV